MMLEDKVAIDTGGDSGIRRAIALELAAEGAAVTVNDHRHEEAAKATEQQFDLVIGVDLKSAFFGAKS